MRLFLPSMIMVVYVVVSLVLMLPWRPGFKLAAVLVLLAVSMKYVLYETIGGAFFGPSLPRWLILSMEALYAALVLLFVLLVVRDAVTALLWLSRLLGTSWQMPFSRAAVGGVLTVAALAMGAWGAWQGVRVPDVRTREIVLPGLPAALDGFVFVQLSDLHIGPLLRERWLQAVVEKTNAQNPDVVVITGDFIDGSPAMLGQDVAPLGKLRAKYGVYGVTGNHEYYYNAPAWMPVFEKLGVDMLHNEHRVLTVNGAELVLAGINDPTAARFGDAGPDIRQALDGAPPETVRVLLAHQPRGASTCDGVDLQLSGHTHGGIMIFMRPLIAHFNEGLVGGLYALQNLQLYISAGTGVWNGFSSRVGVPSEITRLVLRARTAS